jgi:predicted N-acyltransferase
LSDKTQTLTAQFLNSIADIDAVQWNALAGGAQPFLRHEFLLAMESTGCAVPATGWTARHVVLRDAQQQALAALPLYEKTHSQGEFVFDFSWANAYHQRRLDYYPKLLSAIPFTPVSGNRMLIADETARAPLQAALIAVVLELIQREKFSSWHVLFPRETEADSLRRAGLIQRRDCQFHWHNAGYGNFDDFLAGFTAEKRKKAKRERRRVAEAGIVFDTLAGGEVDAALWKVLYGFYADTFHRHGHRPYLNLAFFKRIAAVMPDNLMLKVARIGAEPIAVAIFFQDHDTLYGRYWGSGGNYHSLHFETCYYQGIEYCIQRGLRHFEPGTQGEHKVPRGFVPSFTSSSHFIAHPGFDVAIRDFAAREAQAVDNYAQGINEHLPFHREPTTDLKLTDC